MSASTTRPISRRVQARVMRMVNVPMRRVLGLPFRTPLSGRLMLVFLTGRRTGKSYRQPLSYVRQGSTLLTPGGGKWKLNLQDGQPVRIRLAGHDVYARPEIVTDTDEIGQLLEAMIRVNPRVKSFTRIPEGPDGRPDRAGLENAVKYGFRIVRWHLDEPGTRPPAA